MAVPVAAAEPRPAVAAPAARYRPELQGLRGVAVALVVVYHVWIGRVSGGVDVFFLISGFLVTGQLVRAARGRGIALWAMWGRFVKRLFPAALTVLAAVVVAGALLLPEHRWFQTIREVLAAALFYENWQLVADSADYFQQRNEASVVQHFWSLSIQVQFYLVWPLLAAGVVLIARRPVPALRNCLVLVFAASLAYSVVLTAQDQPAAYFHSLTRAWEFAIGGLLALGVHRVRGSAALGWAGLVGLCACGVVLQVGTVFPGWAALWPTLSAAAVIAAGSTGSAWGADRFLGSRPLRYLGDISYALYLWHWPVLVFAALLGGDVGLLGGLAVIGVSVALSVLTHHGVEQPVRNVSFRTPWGPYAFGALLLIPVLVAVWCWQVVGDRKAATYRALVDNANHPGALAREPGFEYWGEPEAPVVPPLVALPDDYALIEGSTCVPTDTDEALPMCTSPVVGEPEKRIVVVGDSHMQQYLAALGPVAQRRNWQVISMLKGACPFSTESETLPGDEGCLRWNAQIVAQVVAIEPDVVLTNGTRDVRVGLTEHTPPGFVAQWRTLAEAGIPVVAVRDNPRYDFGPSACADAKGLDAPECLTPRSQLFAAEPPYAKIPDLPDTVHFLDFTDYFCTEDVCPPAIGNVYVYLDDNHVSATYMSTMSKVVERALDEWFAGAS